MAEVFYFVAWRLLQELRRQGELEFPGLEKIKAKSVSLVRNQLLEHPEHAGAAGHFEQHLVVTDDGPVLKTTAAVFRLGSGRAEPPRKARQRLVHRGG